MELDLERWTGEGEFTQVVIDRLRRESRIALLRVEDAPASREEAGYNFVSNEIYVRFTTQRKAVRRRALGLLRISRVIEAPSLTMPDLGALLEADPAIGSPDYADASLLQYLRTQRIIPPYQTRGYKLVELVRIYEVGPAPIPY